jgi:hypothetical protein
MIGGHDICFRTDSSAQVTEGVIRIVRVSWQEAIVENAETGEILHRHALGVRELPTELFIYKDAIARNSWMAEGAIPENANLMVHIICGDDSMTVVVDEPNTAEMATLLAAVRDHVCQDIFWMRANAA